MSKAIDERVVSLQFDNKHFESNVQTSMSTLDKLKQKLNFNGCAKGMDELATSAETVSAKFSALDVVAVTALANITNKAVNAGTQLAKSLSVDQITAGFNKYEQKTASIQTIMNATGKSIDEVNEYLEKLMWFSDETSYGFTDMTSALATMTSSGGDIEKLIPMITGVANATAFAGKGAAEFSRIMQFAVNQAYSTGYMQVQDWKSIEGATVNSKQLIASLIQAGEELGKIEKGSINANNFRASLADKWLDKEVMEAGFGAFAEFSDAVHEMVASGEVDTAAEAIERLEGDYAELGVKAFKSAQEAKTFTEAIDATKDAVSSGWMKTFEILFGNYEQAKVLWTEVTGVLWDVFAAGAEVRNFILDAALNNPFAKLLDKLTGIVDATKEAVNNVKDLGDIVDRVIRGDFGNQWDNGDRNYRKKLVEAEGYEYAVVQNLVNEKLGSSVRLKTKADEANKDLAESQGELNESMADSIDSLLLLNDEELKSLGLTADEIKMLRALGREAERTGKSLSQLITEMSEKSGRELLGEAFSNLGDSLLNIVQAIRDAWRDIFPKEDQAIRLYNLIKAFNKFTEYLKVNEDAAEDFRRTFRGVFAALDIVLTIIGGPIKLAFKILGQLLDAFDIPILEFTGNIGDAIVAFRDWLDSVLDFTGVFKWMAPYVVKAAKATRDWLVSLKDSAFVKSLAGHLKNAATAVKDFFVGIKDSAALQTFLSYLKKTGTAIADWFKGIKDADNIPMYIIQGLANGIRKGASAVWNAMVELATGLITKIKDVLGIHSPSTVFMAIGGFIIAGLVLGLTQGFPQVGEAIKTIGSKIGELFTNLDWGNIFAVVGSAAMLTLGYKLVDAFQNISKVFGGFGEMMEEITIPIARVIKGFANTLNAISFNIATEGVKNIAMSLLMIAAAIALIVLVADDPEELWTAVGIVAVLAGVLIGLAIAMTKLESSSVEISKSGASLKGLRPSLLTIGAAILLLVWVAKIIGDMEWSELGKAALGIIFLGGIITGLIAATKLAGPDIDKVGKTISKIAGSMLLLTAVAVVLSWMSWESMGKAAVGLLGLVGVVALLVLITKMAGTSIDQTGKTISKIAGSLLLLTAVAVILSWMSWKGMGKAAVGLLGLVGVIALLVLITKMAGPNVDKLGSTLLAISGSVAILAIVAILLSGMSWEGMGKAAVGLLGLVGIIALLVLIVKMVEKDAPKIAGTLLAISGSIAILALVAILLGAINTESLAKGIFAMGIILAMVAMVAILEKSGTDCKGTMIGIAIAIGVMAAAVALLSFIDPGSLATATACMAALMGMMALLIKSTQGLKFDKGLLALIAISGIVILLAVVLSNLAKNEAMATTALPAAAALSVLMLALSAMLFILDKAVGNLSLKDILIGVVGLLALCIPLLALVGILYLMQGVENATQNAMVLAGLATVLTLLLIPLALVGVIYTATGGMAMLGIVGLLAMCVPLLALVGILALMSGVENAEAGANLLIRLMTALTLMTTILAIVGPFALVGVTAAQSLLSLIGVMALIVTAVGALLEVCPQLETFVDTGIDLMVKLANGIGEMVGAFVGGVLEGVTASLPQVGTNLSDFMTNAQPFIDGAKSIDAATMAGVKSMADIILTLTGANILDGIASWFTGESSLTKFGSELATFGSDLADYADEVKDIDPAAVEASANAAKALADMASTIPNSGGVVAWFAGENSIAAFASELKGLGTGLKDFATEVADVNPEVVTAAANAAKTLAEMTTFIPNSGGVVSWFAGENSVAAFAGELKNLGTGLKDFASEVSGVDPEVVAAAAAAAKTIAEMTSSIPNEGGVVSWFTGENSLSKFAGDLKGLGTGLKDFASEVDGVDPEVVVAGANAAKALAEMADKVPNEDGVVSWFTGNNSLSKFSGDLKGLGTGLKDFATEVDGINPENVTAAANAAKAIAEMTAIIPKEGGIKAWFTGDTAISKFKDELAPLGAAIKDFSDSVAGISPENVEAAANAAKSLAQMASESPKNADKLGKFGEQLTKFSANATTYYDNMSKVSAETIESAESVIDSIKALATDIDSSKIKKAATAIKDVAKALQQAAKVKADAADGFADAMENIASTSVDAIIEAFDDSNGKLEDAGKNAIASAISGAESKSKAAATAFKGIANAAASALNQVTAFTTAGLNAATGFANGISSGTYLATNAGSALGKAALSAAMAALDENSPSKEMYKVGAYAGQGFVNALGDYVDKAYQSGEEMADSTRMGLSNAIARVTDAINSDIDAQPTIRPVLDLSDVQAGANSLNGMFGNRTMSIDTRTAMATAASMRGYQNGGNTDVVSAIKGLRKDINNMPRNTYSVGDVTYDDGSEVANAVQALVRAARVERRS